jgi:hypothetical protein
MSHEVFIDGKRYVPESKEPGPWGDLPPGYLSPHFREAEFTCNHCGSLGGHTVPAELLHVLEDVRSHFGDSPVTITSGYRCKTHNDNVGSTDKSQHRKCTAADIQLRDATPRSVHVYLTQSYPDKYGIGRYDSFTHVDVRLVKARW